MSYESTDHKHLIMTIRINPEDKLNQEEYMLDFLEDLVLELEMKLLPGLPKNPFFVTCEKEGNEGITAGAIIDTSHIMLHTWNKDNPIVMQLDIYSCKPFNVQKVLNFIQNSFSVKSWDWKKFDRKYMIVEQGTNQ